MYDNDACHPCCLGDTQNDARNNQASDEDTEDAEISLKIDRVSDEVYKQLLEFYFYLTTFIDMLIDNIDHDEKSDMNWHEDNELYNEAIEIEVRRIIYEINGLQVYNSQS